MSAAASTTVALSERIDRATTEVASARAALSTAQEARDHAVVAGESELAVARVQKALDDARAALAAAEERLALLERALEREIQQRAADHRLAQIRGADALLVERVAEVEKLEAALANVAESAKNLARLSRAAIEALPNHPQWTPPMFEANSLTSCIGLRLMALTEGGLIPAKCQLTLHEAQKLPTLTARAEAARADILQQFGIAPPAPTKKSRGTAARS